MVSSNRLMRGKDVNPQLNPFCNTRDEKAVLARGKVEKALRILDHLRSRLERGQEDRRAVAGLQVD